MITCRWTVRRLQRYLDADPSAPLSAGDVRRLEAHLAECARCSQVLAEHRLLRRSLGRWGSRTAPDPLAVERIRRFLERLNRSGSP